MLLALGDDDCGSDVVVVVGLVGLVVGLVSVVQGFNRVERVVFLRTAERRLVFRDAFFRN